MSNAGVSGRRDRISASNASPSMPGILISVTIAA
jgi:hypothetical protein